MFPQPDTICCGFWIVTSLMGIMADGIFNLHQKAHWHKGKSQESCSDIFRNLGMRNDAHSGKSLLKATFPQQAAKYS